MASPKSTPASENLSDYPIQRHAGKVGYGPNYNVEASVVDKVEGLTEEVVGKVTHNPKLVNKGHEMHTGELKRRQVLGEESEEDPFSDRNKDPQTVEKKSIAEVHPPSKTAPSKTASSISMPHTHTSNVNAPTGSANEAALN